MDEVDDGLGSELNTPRDSHQSTQADVSLDTSVEPSSVPTTSTPKNANRQCGVSSSPFGLDLSAVQEATVEDTSSSVKRQDESGDYSALDWAANLASKQMELLQLTDEHGRTRQQLQSIQEVISQLQSRVSSAEDTIDDLNSERMALLAKLEQYKKSSENKEMALTKYKEELLLAHEKLKQLENISVEVEVEKEADHEVIAKLMSENEESKALISQLKQEAQQREEELLREKEALLLAANEERYQLADWRDRATRLEQLANSQSAQMKRYEVMEQRFSDTVKHLADQRAKVSELSGELKVQTDNAKMYHDEVLHLRAKLDEMKLASACAANDSSTSKELVRLRDECERLQNQLEAGREIKAEWTVFKRSNEEMRGRVEKQENELAELRDALSEKRKQLDNVEDERTRLKHKCAQLEIDLEALHAEFAAFQNGAEMQYQAEMAQLKEIIHEKDERLDRLHTRIAEYESYPGMNSSIVLSEGSSAAANTTLWDMMPEELREQFQLLRQRYNELDAMVQKMMESHIAANNESFGRHSKVMENKMTDCDDLMRPSPERPLSGGMQSGHELAAVAVASNMDAVSERTLSEGVQPSNMDVSATANDNIQSIIGGLLRSVRMAEVNGKLTPNIRQLLDMLLTDVARSSLSAECIDEAVNRFFANLDLALRRTLSTSDDNRRRCEELENARAEALEERRVMSEELRAAQDRYAIFEAKAETLKLQLKEEGRKVIELRNEIEQLTQHIHRLDTSNTGLKGIVTQQQMEIDEKAAACRKSAEYLEDFRIELEKMGVYADMLNERLRQANREKEDLKRRLGDRDCEMARLEERLVDSINQCTTRASDVQKFEKRLAAAQLQNDTLKRKYDKRETFLEQMEALLRAMKVRNDALREANRLRQNKLDVVMKFLARHGIDVGEGFDVRPRSALDEEQEEGHNLEAKGASGDVNDSVRNSVGPVDISEAAVARLMRRLDRYTSQIEMREREGAIDDIRIPSWRSISESTSSRCGSESGDPHPNVDSTPSNPPENLLINSP